MLYRLILLFVAFAVVPVAVIAQLQITEVMASNTMTYMDPDHKVYTDWI